MSEYSPQFLSNTLQQISWSSSLVSPAILRVKSFACQLLPYIFRLSRSKMVSVWQVRTILMTNEWCILSSQISAKKNYNNEHSSNWVRRNQFDERKKPFIDTFIDILALTNSLLASVSIHIRRTYPYKSSSLLQAVCFLKIDVRSSWIWIR